MGSCEQVYPSSHKRVVDWNQLEHDIKEEEKNEVLDGDAGVQKLFRTIYASAMRPSCLVPRCVLILTRGLSWSAVGHRDAAACAVVLSQVQRTRASCCTS